MGEFKQVIELPKIFDKLNDDDFEIQIGFFTRDKVEVPFIYGISIVNIQKYQMIKIKEDRMKKLNKISSNEN